MIEKEVNIVEETSAATETNIAKELSAVKKTRAARGTRTAKKISTAKEDIAKMSKEEREKVYRYMRDRDRQMVKGIFRFHEVPAGIMSFVYKEYKEDPVAKYDLTDGEVYTIPLGVAKHLNKNVWYPINANQLDEAGNVSKLIGRKVKRCSFQSLDFTGMEDLGEQRIEEVTVTDIPRL